MPSAGYPKKCWNFCMPEDEIKNITDFYWVMFLMYTFWEYLGILAIETFVNI